jgi:hypothetical protein
MFETGIRKIGWALAGIAPPYFFPAARWLELFTSSKGRLDKFCSRYGASARPIRTILSSFCFFVSDQVRLIRVNVNLSNFEKIKIF